MDSLRLKMLLGMLGPLVVVVGLFAYLQYELHRRMLVDIAERTAIDMSHIVESSLQHALLAQDESEVRAMIDSVATNPQIVNLFLLNSESEVQASATPDLLGRRFAKTDVGCAVCHTSEAAHGDRFSTILDLPEVGRTLRACDPIENQAACYACHDPAQPFNGVLIMDLSLAEVDEHAQADLQRMLLLLGGALLLGAILLGVTMERSVIEPVGKLTRAIRDFDQGDLSRRAPIESHDEIGELAAAFNRMADGLEEKAKLEQKVRERTAELQALYEELQQKEAVREQLLKQVINAQEEERKRVARELHDELAQTLSGLLMSLDAAENVLGSELDPVHRQLVRTRDITQQALEQTRHLILDLRPTILDDLGLVPAIRWYAETHLKGAGILISFHSEGDERRLSPEIETALFRIAQEAINNITRHAQATRANINLIWNPDELVITIRDNGRGFDRERVMNRRDGTQGMGLLGMQERATLLGGRLEISSIPGKGTRVVARVPIP